MRIYEFTALNEVDELYINEMLESELYLVREGWRGYKSLAFFCPCGCGGFHNVPVFVKGEEREPDFCAWEYTKNGDKITLHPSLLNGCKAHFFIRDNKVVWC